MKIPLILFFVLSALLPASGQVAATHPNYIWVAKEFSKDQALFNSKSYLFREILGANEQVLPFEIISLAAASSGELTTLIYNCESRNKEGLILGFYGDYWNTAGVVYKSFAFKNLERAKAIEFLTKLEIAIVSNSKFLREDPDNNNIVFTFEDMEVLIWASPAQGITIRLFWNGFDSTWEQTAFERSKRRFEKKLKG